MRLIESTNTVEQLKREIASRQAADAEVAFDDQTERSELRESTVAQQNAVAELRSLVEQLRVDNTQEQREKEEAGAAHAAEVARLTAALSHEQQAHESTRSAAAQAQADHQKQMQAHAERAAELEASLEELRREYSDHKEAVREAADAAAVAVRTEQARAQKLSEQVASLTDKLSAAERQLEDARGALEELKAAHSNQPSHPSRPDEQQVAQLQPSTIVALQREVAELKSDLRERTAQLDSVSAASASVLSRLDELEEHRDAEQGLWESERDVLETALRDARHGEADALRSLLGEKETRIKELEIASSRSTPSSASMKADAHRNGLPILGAGHPSDHVVITPNRSSPRHFTPSARSSAAEDLNDDRAAASTLNRNQDSQFDQQDQLGNASVAAESTVAPLPLAELASTITAFRPVLLAVFQHFGVPTGGQYIMRLPQLVKCCVACGVIDGSKLDASGVARVFHSVLRPTQAAGVSDAASGDAGNTAYLRFPAFVSVMMLLSPLRYSQADLQRATAPSAGLLRTATGSSVQDWAVQEKMQPTAQSEGARVLDLRGDVAASRTSIVSRQHDRVLYEHQVLLASNPMRIHPDDTLFSMLVKDKLIAWVIAGRHMNRDAVLSCCRQAAQLPSPMATEGVVDSATDDAPKELEFPSDSSTKRTASSPAMHTPTPHRSRDVDGMAQTAASFGLSSHRRVPDSPSAATFSGRFASPSPATRTMQPSAVKRVAVEQYGVGANLFSPSNTPPRRKPASESTSRPQQVAHGWAIDIPEMKAVFVRENEAIRVIFTHYVNTGAFAAQLRSLADERGVAISDDTAAPGASISPGPKSEVSDGGGATDGAVDELHISDMTRLCQDFRLVPGLCSHARLVRIFRQVIREDAQATARFAAARTGHSSDEADAAVEFAGAAVSDHELQFVRFAQFVEVLARMALQAFTLKAPLKPPGDAAVAFLQWMDRSDGRYVKDSPSVWNMSLTCFAGLRRSYPQIQNDEALVGGDPAPVCPSKLIQMSTGSCCIALLYVVNVQ